MSSFQNRAGIRSARWIAIIGNRLAFGLAHGPVGEDPLASLTGLLTKAGAYYS